MGRIRRTIIMGNPRGFVLKKFALIIATWAVVSVLVPTGASAVAAPDRVEEVNCDAVQVVIRVPPQNIDPLVPEEFKLRLNREMAGLAIGANHCQGHAHPRWGRTELPSAPPLHNRERLAHN